MLSSLRQRMTPDALTNAGRSTTYKMIMSPSFNVANFITRSAFTDNSHIGTSPNMVKDFVVEYPELAGEENIQKAFGTYYLSKCGASVRRSNNIEKCEIAKQLVRVYGDVNAELPSAGGAMGHFSNYGYVVAEMIKSGVSFGDLGLDRYLLENKQRTSKEFADAWGVEAIGRGLLTKKQAAAAAERVRIRNNTGSYYKDFIQHELNKQFGLPSRYKAARAAEMAAGPRAGFDDGVVGGPLADAEASAAWEAEMALRNPPPGGPLPAPAGPPPQALWGPSPYVSGGSRRKSQRRKRGRKARRTRRH